MVAHHGHLVGIEFIHRDQDASHGAAERMRRNGEQVGVREGKGRSVSEAMSEIAAQNPQQRIIQPQEIASLAAFLCRDEAKGITAENIQITGGALW